MTTVGLTGRGNSSKCAEGVTPRVRRSWLLQCPAAFHAALQMWVEYNQVTGDKISRLMTPCSLQFLLLQGHNGPLAGRGTVTQRSFLNILPKLRILALHG